MTDEPKLTIPPPGSAIERQMLRQMRDAELAQLIQPMSWLFKADNPIVDRIQFKVRRAPYTDDAWQMLDDLGIEPARRRVRLPPTNEITITHKQIVWPQ